MQYSGLIIGLGNPGSKFNLTRHNMGYIFIDELLDLARREGRVDELNGKKFNSLLWRVEMPDLDGVWLAAKPLTFMNDSGAAAQPLLAWHNLAPDQLVVVQDELDIPPGALRFKFGGGMAGHNGLLSITQRLGTKNYYRLRIGVGKPEHKDDTVAWVLGRPPLTQKEIIMAAMPYAVESFLIFSRSGIEKAEQFAHATAGKLENKSEPVFRP